MPGVAARAAGARLAGAGLLVARWSLHAGFGYERAKARYQPFYRLVDEGLPARHALAELAVASLAAGQPVYIIGNSKADKAGGSAPVTLGRLADAVRDRLRGTAAVG